MTQEAVLKAITGETDEDILSAYLDMAATAIVNRVYPFEPDNKEVPEKYKNKQLEIAAYLLNKRGAEGEIVHNENGINRSYESASVSPSLLRDVVPFVGTFGEVPKNDSSKKKQS